MWKSIKGELRFKVRVLLTNGYLFLVCSIVLLSAVIGAFSQPVPASVAGKDTLSIIVTPGWNLVALPRDVLDGRVSVLFPTSIYKAFEYQGSYVPRDTMQFGMGYWLKFSAPETVSVIGQLRANETLTLRKGWNLIGGLSFPLPVNKLTQSPSNLLVSQFFTYSANSYVTADTLEPGRAYWVKTSQPGTLSEYCWQSPDQALISPPDGYTSPSNPLLIWAMSVCADNYRLQIGWDSLFTSPILDSTLTDTSYQVSSPCDTARQFWRVGMISSSQDTVWSSSRSYRWGYVEQGLVTPGDNGGTTLTPTLKWRQTNCTGLYHLQLSTDSSFITMLVDSVLADTIYQSGQLDSAETYYWRVGSSTYWTNTHRFTVTWKYLGLKDQAIEALAAHLSNPSTVYAGSSSNFSFGATGGIFKTVNGGSTWDTLVRGVTVYDLDVHPQNPNILYATLGVHGLTVGGILKTTDAGATWSQRDSGIYIFGLDTGPQTLSIDPEHPETLYCGTGGPFGGSMFKTTNGGLYWFYISQDDGPFNITSIAIDPLSTGNVYVGCWNAGGIFKTTDGGATWTKLSFVGYPNDIAVNPSATDNIYAGERGFFVSSDSGVSWTADNQGFQNLMQVYRIRVSASGSEMYCNAGSVYKKEKGATWAKIGIEGIAFGIYSALCSVGNSLFTGNQGIYKYLR